MTPAAANARLVAANRVLLICHDGWEPTTGANWVHTAPRPLNGEPIEIPAPGFWVDASKLSVSEIEANQSLDAAMVVFVDRETCVHNARVELKDQYGMPDEEVDAISEDMVLEMWSGGRDRRWIKKDQGR